jgi:hypothetical protein
MKIPKMPKIDLGQTQRSRLKVTFIFGGSAFLLCLFPMYIIYIAADVMVFDIVAPWTALAALVTAFTGIAGYYLSRETQRPSLLSNTFVGMGDVEKRILDGEDESDPESIPL